MSEYDFEIVYTKGSLHQDIDCLSRAPVDDAIDPYLENRVYCLMPKSVENWISSYNDDESENFLEKARQKRDGFELKNEIITKDGKTYVPASKRKEITLDFHEANARHGGFADTMYGMQQLYWPNMHEDVKQIVRECDICQRQKVERQLPTGEMYHFEVYSRNEQIAIDVLGPMSPTLRGNAHAIVAIDMFTRFVEAKAVSSIDASSYAEFLVEFCGRYGMPKQILTDNAPNFKNALARDVAQILNIEALKTTPYHSRGNAIVERVIQTLQGKLGLISSDSLSRANWDLVLPIAVLNINTSFHKSIGYSPYEMVFGYQPTISSEFADNIRPTDLYAQLLKRQLEDIHSNAITSQIKAVDLSRPHFERRHRPREFEIGDLVLVRIGGRKPKLANNYSGPFRVLERERDIYKIQSLDERTVLTRHTSSLKPYYGSPDQREIANRPVTYRR
jgi:transposase InsO family protein